MKTAVVILNWNGRNFLEKFLPSVTRYSKGDASIFIIDNASSDDSISFVKTHYPEITILKNAHNGGFSKGYNEGLKKIDAQYFVLLNSDVEVTENWIAPIVQLLDEQPEIAACQPKIKSFHQKNQFEYAGAAGGFLDKHYYPFCRGRIFDSVEEDNGQYDNTREVFWASGACLFVRADLYSKLGGLDEDFFAHMEEIDLCWRLKNTGYKIMASHLSTVYHVGGGTLSKINPRKTFLNFRNNLFIITKNCERKKLFPMLFKRMVLDGIAAGKFLFSGSPSHAFAVLRAHFSFYAQFNGMYKKRKLVTPIPYTSTSTQYKKSIIWDYYVRQHKHFSEIDSRNFLI
ncbi:MAG: glycosyltransferase family 2 protein [Bacteroidetes bacterium]|nr:glycosyltransferase family 2 protein [Bacteroidota bacterium]